MSARSSEKLEGWGQLRPGVAAARREEKRGRTYTREGGRGARPGAERERAGVVRCLLLQMRCLSRAWTGLSWTVAAWITTRPSNGDGWFQSGLDGIRTAVKRAWTTHNPSGRL